MPSADAHTPGSQDAKPQSTRAGPGWDARTAGPEQGLTFLQSLQNTDELPRKPSTSPQSRHWDRPFPITFRLMVSSRSTSRLQHRTQSQREPASCLGAAATEAQNLTAPPHVLSPTREVVPRTSPGSLRILRSPTNYSLSTGVIRHGEYRSKHARDRHGPCSHGTYLQ